VARLGKSGPGVAQGGQEQFVKEILRKVAGFYGGGQIRGIWPWSCPGRSGAICKGDP